MAHRKGIAAVVFRRKRKPEFLLLHRILNWSGYEFPKGGRKAGESEADCLAREMQEELGTKKYRVAAKTDYRIEYGWLKKYKKDGKQYRGVSYRLFVVEFLGDKIKYDPVEHDDFVWANAKKAHEMLTYNDQKEALIYALEILKRRVSLRTPRRTR